MRIEWDKSGEKLYETGTDRAVLYPKTAGTHGAGVPWNGLTALTESPSGAEPTPLYADNIKYVTLQSAEEYGFTVEAYMFPEEFAECDGSAAAAKGVYFGQQTRKPFGLCVRTIVGNDEELNEHGYKLHLIYDALAAPSEKGYATVNDSPEVVTLSWECTTTPVNVPGFKPTASVVIDSTKADPTKLDALEDILYGTEENEPRLPLPAEIITLMADAA